MPSSLVLASKAMISDSVEERETAPCFLQIHVIGTKVLGPTITRYAPVVDFESSRLSAKLSICEECNLKILRRISYPRRLDLVSMMT